MGNPFETFKGRNETINETQMEVLTVHSDVLKQIWKPDLFFSNEKDAATHKIVTENALIRYKSGLIDQSVS